MPRFDVPPAPPEHATRKEIDAWWWSIFERVDQMFDKAQERELLLMEALLAHPDALQTYRDILTRERFADHAFAELGIERHTHEDFMTKSRRLHAQLRDMNGSFEREP